MKTVQETPFSSEEIRRSLLSEFILEQGEFQSFGSGVQNLNFCHDILPYRESSLLSTDESIKNRHNIEFPCLCEPKNDCDVLAERGIGPVP